MDRGAWWAAVHWVAKSWTQLSDFTFTFHFYALEKEMATHSSVLAWRIRGTAEPGGLPSMGSHRVAGKCSVPRPGSPFPSTPERREGLPRNNEKLATDTGEGNGTPLQHSCLENPMDGGA